MHVEAQSFLGPSGLFFKKGKSEDFFVKKMDRDVLAG
jgi:hypothetical protein